MRQISHIIFDWDGTLMDSASKIVNCMQTAAGLSDLPIPSALEVQDIIGISLVPAIEKLFGISQHDARHVAEHYKRVFVDSDKTPCSLFDGAQDTLKKLFETHTLGVATGKARRGLQRAFDSSGTQQYFDNSICSDEAESKPSSDMLLKLLKRWRLEPHQALMVGDTVYDMQMAENIGMPRVGVSFGVHSVDRLLQHKPIAVINSIDELPKLLM